MEVAALRREIAERNDNLAARIERLEGRHDTLRRWVDTHGEQYSELREAIDDAERERRAIEAIIRDR